MNFQNIANKGSILYFVLESYESHPDYIAVLTAKFTEPPKKKKAFKDFLNDILYSKLVQLEVIMQWYLASSKA